MIVVLQCNRCDTYTERDATLSERKEERYVDLLSSEGETRSLPSNACWQLRIWRTSSFWSKRGERVCEWFPWFSKWGNDSFTLRRTSLSTRQSISILSFSIALYFVFPFSLSLLQFICENPKTTEQRQNNNELHIRCRLAVVSSQQCIWHYRSWFRGRQ